MAIQEDTVVYIAFKLKNTNGTPDEASKDAPLPFIAGREQIIPIEAALLGKQDGDIVNIVIQPDDAGNYDEAFIQEASKDMFNEVEGPLRAWTWKLKWKQKKVTR